MKNVRPNQTNTILKSCDITHVDNLNKTELKNRDKIHMNNVKLPLMKTYIFEN